MGIKHRFMTLLWRVQQSQALVAPLFYAATLTGVFWPTVGTYLKSKGFFAPSQVALGLTILFFFMLFIIIAIGVVYDRVFKLWREQLDVGVERNPYLQEKLAPKEIVLWKKMHLRTLQQVADENPKADRDIQFMERWIERSMADPRIRSQVEALERWIEGSSSGPPPVGGEPVIARQAASEDRR